MHSGTALAIYAYLLWGLLPIFWKGLHHLPAHEIIGHRILWSFLLTLGLLIYRRHLKKAWNRLAEPRVRWTYLATGLIITGNWLTFIWAINNGYLVEASLGYFLNPLITVLLGVIFLKERLRGMQWAALILVLAGVAVPMIQYGRLPWIALILAFSFAFYSLIKKTGPLESLDSMTVETGWVALPSLAFLIYWDIQGKGAFGHAPLGDTLLLMLTGLATALPLLFFTAAARKIPLSRIGVLQYLAPTLQFILGITLYHEPFSQAQATGFILVWVAIALYLAEGFLFSHRTKVTMDPPLRA